MVRRLALTATLLALFAGCGEGAVKGDARPPAPERTGSPTPSTSPAPTPSPEAEPSFGTRAEARRTFRRLQDELFRAGRGRFATQLRMGADSQLASVSREGSYDVVGFRSDYEMTIGTPSEEMRMAVRSQRSDAWFSFLDLPRQRPRERCWVHLDAGVIEDATDIRFPAGPGLGFPAEVVVFATTRVSGYNASSDLTADADLYSVAGAFGGQTASRLGIPPRSRARVPIVVDLYDGDLVGWYAEFSHVVEAAFHENYLPRRLTRAFEEAGASAFDGRIDVDLDDTGKAWRFDPPPARDVIEMGRGESFETAMRTCTGLGQDGA